LYDLAYLQPIPGIEIFAPRDYRELRHMLHHALLISQGLVVIRYPRGAERTLPAGDTTAVLPVGQAQVLRSGTHLTLAACGSMVRNAMLAASQLAGEGISCEVIDIRRVKPLDLDTILASCQKTGRMATLEDGVVTGGVGMTLAAIVAQRCPGLPVAVIAAGDHPVVQGSVSRIHEREGMDPASIAATCRELAGRASMYPVPDSCP